LFAEPPLQAEIMIRSSMIVSLILGLPDWTTKTSFSRTLFRIRTLVSPYGEKSVSRSAFLRRPSRREFPDCDLGAAAGERRRGNEH